MEIKEPDITYDHIREDYDFVSTIDEEKKRRKRILYNETLLFLFEEAIILSILFSMFCIL